MATSPASGTPAAEVYDLIAAFAEAADARLRGNAAHALSVLASGADVAVSERARDDLLQVLSAEPGGIGMDWQRRFVPRALDAVRQLPESHRQWICDGLLKVTNSSTTELTQRQATARLTLAGAAPSLALWNLNWLQYFRLTRLAGKPGFWSGVWAVGWRSALGWFLALALLPALFAQFKDDISDLTSSAWEPLLLGASGLSVLVYLSLPGRLRPPRYVWVADVAVSAALFGILAVVGTSIFAPRESLFPLIVAAILGAAIGAATRTLRWSGAWSRIEPEDTARFLRPLTALVIATTTCMIVAAPRMGVQMLSAVWIVLAPAALVTTLLDLWLEDNGPQPLTPGAPRRDRRWAVPLAAALGSVVAIAIWFYNVKGHDASGAEPQVAEVRLPGALARAEQMEIPTRLNRRVPLIVEEDGWYRIVAVRSHRAEDTVLYVHDKSGALEVRQDDPEPPTTTVFLKHGEYTACVALSNNNDGCSPPSTVTPAERVRVSPAGSVRAQLEEAKARVLPVQSAMELANLVLTRSREMDRTLTISMGPKDEEVETATLNMGTIRAGSVVRVRRGETSRYPKWTEANDPYEQRNLVVKRIFQAGPLKEIVFEDQDSGLRWNTAWISEIVPAPERVDSKK